LEADQGPRGAGDRTQLVDEDLSRLPVPRGIQPQAAHCGSREHRKAEGTGLRVWGQQSIRAQPRARNSLRHEVRRNVRVRQQRLFDVLRRELSRFYAVFHADVKCPSRKL
jgi:hypothetical protein